MRPRCPGAVRALAAWFVFFAVTMIATRAGAADNEGVVREAARHFQRGVGLYREADYHGALTEFQRACELVPAPVTFYNIGETDFQLRDYAGALTAFERYLAESALDEHHRAEVEASVEILRTRVGHVLVTTVPPGADITIDDQTVGKTPFEKAVRVTIGHHRVTASMPGHPTVQRYVDVAAEDEISLDLSLPASDPEAPPPQGRAIVSPGHVESAPSHGSALRAFGWVTTGALAVGGAAFAVLANEQSKDLERARSDYPITRDTLNHDATVTTTYAVLADSLIAAAVLVGGITLVSSLSSPSGPKVTVGVSSVRFETTF